DNATFYLSTYSINGEKWLLNHGFDALYTLSNFEWMLHYIPIGQYSSWPWYFLNFNNYYQSWQGGHAVTIVGYTDTAVTPDGQGALVMVNSWGTGWGDNGYWKFSYQAIRSAGENFNVSIDGVFNTSFQIEWPTIYGGSTAFVYVPKAANYTPTAMITLGIKHPLRGEIIDGVFDYLNGETVPGGIPVAVYAVEGNQKEELWGQSFLNFMIDEIWANTTTPVNLSTWAIPQAHPFPNSPMAFDITGALESLSYYVNSGHPLPKALEVVVRLRDKVIDNYTGSVYEYGLTVMTPDGHQIQVSKNDINVAIPQGKYVNITIEIPLAQMKKYVVSHGHRGIVRKSKFEVTAVTLVKPESAYLYMKNILNGKVKKFKMSTTDGFYFVIKGSSLRGLRPGPYKYWIVFVYGNGQKLSLPAHRVNLGR
uniref:C1 family peptidase n=1 Tax=Thermococcus sp. TaxID=35749 RepID=UPI0025DEC170